MLVIEYNRNNSFGVEFEIKQKLVKEFKETIQKRFDTVFPDRIVRTTQYNKYVTLVIEVNVENCSEVVKTVKEIARLDNLSII